VVRWIDDLAARGLVARTQDARDRRRNVISITGQGRSLLEALDGRLARAQQEFLSELSPEERGTLVALLAKVLGIPPG